jgi:2-dehydro-3-deoxygluconokinase
MPDLITLGESMVRLSVPAGMALERASQLDVNVAGAESNMAITASRMGLSTCWISRLPANPLGRLIAGTISSQGVDISRVMWTPQGRVGAYYVEFGSPPRANQVIYDRAGSAAAGINPDELDWDYLTTARIVHLTGITPALSPSCAAVVRQAIRVAHDHRIPISFDVNYRSKLWSPADAAAALTPLLQGVHILRTGRDEAEALFGLHGGAEQVARELHSRFAPSVVVVTDSGNPAVAFDGTTLNTRDCHPVRIVDEIGAGDAFNAGFLVGYLEHGSVERGLEFGQALAALKLTYTGDIAWCTRAEVEALVGRREAGWR